MTSATQLLPIASSLSPTRSSSHSHTVCPSLGALNMQITSFLIKITVQCFWFLALELACFENTFLADFVWLRAHRQAHTHARCMPGCFGL